eukprot:CAMPEP_0172773548 /NCGR_PEP_ID=MMETSP1074-20121228/194476_1 /TAXON_ID=2916 /ORGANISM="Ceratium fusus, Strain PA161109" /LENGTH=80 /DNA_ID=CAMNT_0013609839 /DNA_START=36 /DNA_END=274 /DNA_ORIENTATION=+
MTKDNTASCSLEIGCGLPPSMLPQIHPGPLALVSHAQHDRQASPIRVVTHAPPSHLTVGILPPLWRHAEDTTRAAAAAAA